MNLSLEQIEAGQYPDGFIGVSERNPNETGVYETIDVEGSMSRKAAHGRHYFRLQHGFGRWAAGDWVQVVAWKEQKAGDHLERK
jgi:hypothetical protein